MKIKDLYDNPDDIELMQSDLKQVCKIILEWIEGEDIDADDAHYMGMLLLSLVNETSE